MQCWEYVSVTELESYLLLDRRGAGRIDKICGSLILSWELTKTSYLHRIDRWLKWWTSGCGLFFSLVKKHRWSYEIELSVSSSMEWIPLNKTCWLIIEHFSHERDERVFRRALLVDYCETCSSFVCWIRSGLVDGVFGQSYHIVHERCPSIWSGIGLIVPICLTRLRSLIEEFRSKW
jgi:hypothetical protein